MKFYSQKWIFLLALISFFACSDESEPEEPQLPEIATTTSETQAVITFTSVEISGAVAEDETINSYGVVWATSPDPTMEDNIALPGNNSSQASVKKSRTKQSQTNDFTVKITDLDPGTTYYFRTFASNDAGTAYGEEISLGTSSLAGSSWEITFLNLDETLSWIGQVTFYEDGTAFYTEPEFGDMYDFWGLWSIEGDQFTYQIREDIDDVYILTGKVEETGMSGTYNVYSEGAIEVRPFTGLLLSMEAE